MLFWLCRRHLHLSIDEVRALPWYERRFILEMFSVEFGDGESEPVEMVGGDLSSLGITHTQAVD